MSLRLRLALWYGGLTGLVVLIVSVLTYAVHTRAHYEDVDRILASAAVHAAEEHAAALFPHPTGTIRELGVPGVEILVYDAADRLVAQTPNAELVPSVSPRAVLTDPHEQPFDVLVGLAPPIISFDAGSGAFGLSRGVDGARWRLYALRIAGKEEYLLAAAPLAMIDASVERFRHLVIVFTLVGGAVGLLAGGLVAGRALRPLAVLTATAAAIERSRGFSHRVPIADRRDELGQLAATFNEMLASLEVAYRAQQRFVADASHELRAPLTAIQGNLELLRRQRARLSEADQQEALAEADREATRLTRLVADLLALARADAGVTLRRQRVELDRVLLDAFSEARHLTRGQHLDVGPLEPVVVDGDPDRLKQLLLTLLDNAIKYTPSDGKVTIGLQRDGQTATVTVRDTGVGIAPEDLPHVFERFYRADPARARDPGGTGLGLAIARWIAQQHAGDITLTSKPQDGTTAAVSLPIAH